MLQISTNFFVCNKFLRFFFQFAMVQFFRGFFHAGCCYCYCHWSVIISSIKMTYQNSQFQVLFLLILIASVSCLITCFLENYSLEKAIIRDQQKIVHWRHWKSKENTKKNSISFIAIAFVSKHWSTFFTSLNFDVIHFSVLL